MLIDLEYTIKYSQFEFFGKLSSFSHLFPAVLLSVLPRMYIYIFLDTVLATDVNKYSLASARCQQRWQTNMENWIYF